LLFALCSLLFIMGVYDKPSLVRIVSQITSSCAIPGQLSLCSAQNIDFSRDFLPYEILIERGFTP
ncbi:hypothetical protein, partial [Brevibacillus sp. HB2.2]|uniref:hypothetical protein n=1 Tax=Brevibacillus sp. HB2.2 TaxID=2738846 RepID=UPI001C2BC9A3